ncbi:hypothetical protein E8E13_003464 [Curvularia kusanoi]|uniref:Rhodanese domain-containing protein n=1 Tax=Curvularia kusanoi TaxID=90978 RepID=A0A9P4W9Y3_CURKU|nr:hypothetical protein E8E13_003464 [Curvularia kusanoi]
MASRTLSTAFRLSARAAARRTAAVQPPKEASIGLLRNLSTASRPLNFASQKPCLSIATPFSQRRCISERSDGQGRVYEFEDVLSAIENPSDSRLLVDVREPHEYAADSIPTAINIPVSSHPDALLLAPEEFADVFGFQKPPKGKELVVFCKAGVRSKTAASIARQAGYTNVGEYPGSWNDWVKKGGPGTHSPPPPGGRGEAKGKVGETAFGFKGKESGQEHIDEGVVDSPKGGLFGKQ